MKDMTSEDKITFIKEQGIRFYISQDYPVDKIYILALTKDLIHSEKLGCFGTIDPDSSICNNCYLSSNGSCEELKKYLGTLPPEPKTILKITRTPEMTETNQSVDELMLKLKMKPHKNNYKITKILLESDGKPLTHVVQQIQQTLGGKSVSYVRTAIYQARKLLKTKLNIDVDIVVERIIKIGVNKNGQNI